MISLTGAYRELVFLAWPVFMFLFAYYFPEPMPVFPRLSRVWTWLPAIVITPYILAGLAVEAEFVSGLTNYSSIAPLDRALPHVAAFSTGYIYFLVSCFFFMIFSKSYQPSISPDSRRRLRLLSWGATVAMTPGLLLIIAVLVAGKTDIPDWLGSIVLVLFALFPLTLAYVIVVQRAMDVRVVLRQGLRYALAKNGVRTLQALAVLLVTLTALALVQKKQERPQKILVIAAGLLAVFTIRRLAEKTGAWVDRQFFREAYDAEQVLSELSDGVRGMVEVRSLIETVAERISETLHIPRVAVVLGGSGAYRPAYALGYGAAPDIAFPPGAVKVLERQSRRACTWTIPSPGYTASRR